MGNLLSACLNPSSSQEEIQRRKQQQFQQQQYQQSYQGQYPPSQQQYGGYSQQTGPSTGPYSFAAAAAHAGAGSQGPVAALARDLLQFETTGQVPEGLSRSVKAAKETQALWFKKLLDAWKLLWPPPGTPADVAAFIRGTLKAVPKKEVLGVLAFYNLLSLTPEAQPPPLPYFPPPVSQAHPPPHATQVPPGVKYDFHTMPIDGKAIADGDTVTVYVDVSRDPREAAVVPPSVHAAADARQRARAVRDFQAADRLQREIQDAGYRVFDSEGVLAKKYRLRSRGIDAPESKQQYGTQAGAALRSLVEGRSLRVLIYTTDQYGRSVADMYCGNVFVQEYMLRNGHVWHYSAYDHRPEFAQWMTEAQQARRGLWADSNVQEPWNWRREHPRGGRQLRPTGRNAVRLQHGSRAVAMMLG